MTFIKVGEYSFSEMDTDPGFQGVLLAWRLLHRKWKKNLRWNIVILGRKAVVTWKADFACVFNVCNKHVTGANQNSSLSRLKEQ